VEEISNYSGNIIVICLCGSFYLRTQYVHLIAQNSEAAPDEWNAADQSSSGGPSTVVVKGYLNYKATHHEGKVKHTTVDVTSSFSIGRNCTVNIAAVISRAWLQSPDQTE